MREARGLAVGGCDPTMPAIRATSPRCRWGTTVAPAQDHFCWWNRPRSEHASGRLEPAL